MIERVGNFIARQHLLSPGGRYLVALSGGADSVALLRVLLELGFDVRAAHCNFCLRGEESERDEAFCRRLCASLDVALSVARFDTRDYARLHVVSIEMAARELRYDYFLRLLREEGLDGVCVAHHRDDSVETILLNMVRGTGVEGMKGIAPRNGEVLRPLLCVSRGEIEAYLAGRKQDFIVDSSNLSDDVQRNKIRLNVLPELLRVNPAAVEKIDELGRRMCDARQILDSAVAAAKARVSEEDEGLLRISIPRLLAEPGAETVLWELLKDRGFSSATVEQVFSRLEGQPGREWRSASHSMLVDRDVLLVEPVGAFEDFLLRIPGPGTYSLPDGQLAVGLEPVGEDFAVGRAPERVTLDAAKVKFPLTVRGVREGDWFVPFGMNGRKLVSDFLTDRKISRFQKRRQLIVVDSEGNAVWLVGLRPDNRCRISQTTALAVVLSV